MGLSGKEKTELGLEVGRAFSPAAPIDKSALFAGRTEQIRQVVDAIFQRGRHVVIFGERGVGKTSLAIVLSDLLQHPDHLILAPRTNCDGMDNYSSVWKKIFDEIDYSVETRHAGFTAETSKMLVKMSEALPEKISPIDVRKPLGWVGEQAILVVIIDEFDRIQHGTVRRLFSDTIKMLSDHAVRATLVLVGVADTVDELIAEHQSIERALLQVHMPRMSAEELHKIIENGLGGVGMSIDDDALTQISLLSKGLPHYTHLLGLHSARAAIDSGQKQIIRSHVEQAIEKALTEAQQTIRSTYHKATMSPRRENLYSRVLLACALAETDELGYFAAANVRQPMSQVMRKSYEIPHFARHLHDFCEYQRGPILQKTGQTHRYRFRFINPLMEPYVIMQGITNGVIEREQIGLGTLQRH